MKQDEIIEMAKEAGLRYHIPFFSDSKVDVALNRFAKLVAAKEREACALSCENLAKGWKENPGKDDSGYIALSNAALFIRARGEA